jgi:predicted ATPase
MGLGQYPEHHGQVLLLRDIPMMKSTLQINHYLGFHEQYENSNRRYTDLNLLPKTWSQIYQSQDRKTSNRKKNNNSLQKANDSIVKDLIDSEAVEILRI